MSSNLPAIFSEYELSLRRVVGMRKDIVRPPQLEMALNRLGKYPCSQEIQRAVLEAHQRKNTSNLLAPTSTTVKTFSVADIYIDFSKSSHLQTKYRFRNTDEIAENVAFV